MKKKILIGVGITGILFLITNPTTTDFKTFLVGKYNLKILPNDLLRDENGFVTFGRTSNFLLFSIYTRNYTKTEYLNYKKFTTTKEGKNVYEVPAIKADTFLMEFPNAIEEQYYKLNSSNFCIPMKDTTEFLQDLPEAKKISLSNMTLFEMSDIPKRNIDTSQRYIGVFKNFF